MPVQFLKVNEIFRSIQGESTWVGEPCIFVRLRGCPLRCGYCDTSYAFEEGEKWSIEAVLEKVDSYGIPLVEITGGEPLIQQAVHPLMTKLCDGGYTVLLETSGACSLAPCDTRVRKIVDIKTPHSGAAGSFLKENYDELGSLDEVKFVITNRADFDWAVNLVSEHNLSSLVHCVHFSPVMKQEANAHVQGCEALSAAELTQWILDSGEPIRLQLQMHKFIWSPETRGV